MGKRLHRTSSAAVWAVWTAAHVLLVYFTVVRHWTVGDVHYYLQGVDGTSVGAMDEYPDAAVWPLRLLRLAVPDDKDVFTAAFVFSCLALSAVFTAVLLRRGAWHSALFWSLFVGLSGPVFVTRLDLVPGLLVGCAAGLLFTHPRVASAVLACATATKLWPGMLAAALVGGARNRGTWQRLVTFFVSLAVLVAVTVATSGVDRVLSPLGYQSDRGLQVESVAATPFVVLSAVFPGTWSISYAASKSFEITGPGVTVATGLTTVLTVLLVLAVLAAAVAHLLRDTWTPDSAVAFSAVLVLLLIVTNKVFSPQYLIWLAPLIAVALHRLPGRRTRFLAAGLLVLAALTTVVYPLCYDTLVYGDTAPFPAVVLLARNVGVVVLTVVAVRWWLATRPWSGPGRVPGDDAVPAVSPAAGATATGAAATDAPAVGA
ncbi:hypothetical protein [Corynebacterium bovis]|uniref:hypothetical protein n=1 Tax=Corynebacterium bovis TaxID=36808 RepID=UPI000F6487C7|nr:hypothetical protein [Corynebacterium bovis]